MYKTAKCGCHYVYSDTGEQLPEGGVFAALLSSSAFCGKSLFVSRPGVYRKIMYGGRLVLRGFCLDFTNHYNYTLI